jgi:hypothetical protein
MPVPHPLFAIEEKPDQPDLLHFERSFGADLLACIPGWPTFGGWVVL